jgi:hypothetical protein
MIRKFSHQILNFTNAMNDETKEIPSQISSSLSISAAIWTSQVVGDLFRVKEPDEDLKNTATLWRVILLKLFGFQYCSEEALTAILTIAATFDHDTVDKISGIF